MAGFNERVNTSRRRFKPLPFRADFPPAGKSCGRVLMNVIIILILASLAVALLFLAGFVWAVRSGQYEDTLTPSLRVLAEDNLGKPGDIAASKPGLIKPLERLNPE